MDLKDPNFLIQVYMKDIVLLAAGVPGAITAIAETMLVYSKIDPHAWAGAGHVTMFFKDHPYRGSEIWKLYCICDKKPVNMVALIRGHQLGLVKKSELDRLAKDDLFNSFDFVELIDKIKVQITFNDD